VSAVSGLMVDEAACLIDIFCVLEHASRRTAEPNAVQFRVGTGTLLRIANEMRD
jgi:hypothetical protein